LNEGNVEKAVSGRLSDQRETTNDKMNTPLFAQITNLKSEAIHTEVSALPLALMRRQLI